MAKQLISTAKNWGSLPEIDTYIPSLSDNANIEEAFKLFMYGNFDNGIDVEDKSLYSFLTTFKTGIQSNATAIDGHAAQSNNVHNLGTAGPAGGDGGNIVGTLASQNLFNKTISSPTISNPTFSLSSAISGPNLAPVGSIVMWANATVPAGWLECNGQSTAGYTDLATVVGATVPDLRGRVPAGFNTGDDAFGTLKGTGGSKTTTATHTHGLSSHTHDLSSHTHGDDHRHSGGTGLEDSDHAHLFSFTETSNSEGDTAGRYDSSAATAQGTQTYATTGTTGGARGNGTHAHGFTTNYKSEQGHTASTTGPNNNTSGGPSNNTSEGSSVGATNGNLQPYFTLKFIIKH